LTDSNAERLRVGIVGLGKMGRIRYQELARHPRVTLVAGSDSEPARYRDFPQLNCSPDYRDVLRAEVDAVFVCTPNRYTPEIVVAALEAGKHVFAEKPPGRDMDDIGLIIRAERAAPGCKLKFGFNHRYHAGIREAKRILDSGRLGRVLWMRGIYGKSGGVGFEKEWRSSRAESGGGILLDQGIHMLDLFRFFCGDFTEVKAMVTTAYWPLDMEDNAFALLRDAEGRIAMLHSSSTQWKHRFSLEIYTAEGFLSVNGILSSTRSYGDETITVARKQLAPEPGAATGKPREETLYFDTDPSWELEVAEFVECVLDRQPVREGTSADALAVMDLVNRIYDADRRSPTTRTPPRTVFEAER
jgi:predicted dehydrogenase